jgi:FtsP/CotA-like multicopper oxidase with cupredoxin domain
LPSTVRAVPFRTRWPPILRHFRGISPGPIIRANTGDTILVNVTNGLNGTATALHWHGIYQIGSPWMDGTTGITQCGIPPGESMLYNFTLDGNWTGTTWWHAHFATQYTDGLYGALVVHAPQENVPKYDRDVVVLMNDHYNTPSADLLSAYLADTDIEPANEPVPDGGLVNGVGQFSLCSQYPDQPCVAPGGSMFNFTFEPNMTSVSPVSERRCC